MGIVILLIGLLLVGVLAGFLLVWILDRRDIKRSYKEYYEAASSNQKSWADKVDFSLRGSSSGVVKHVNDIDTAPVAPSPDLLNMMAAAVEDRSHTHHTPSVDHGHSHHHTHSTDSFSHSHSHDSSYGGDSYGHSGDFGGSDGGHH